MIFDIKRDWFFGTLFLVNFIVLVFLFIFRNNLPPEVPLLYGRAIGEQQLAKSNYLIMPLIVSIVFVAFNFFADKKLSNKFLGKIFKGTSIVLTLLSVITILRIFFLIAKL
ncbi:hypothetical protein HYS03_02200 [Candidatus Woesebacteria bacterium]|nr:hypothetical protein [Candidatus Woesebacteria bacterium]QQG47718.1 MAG: hypothetical protein HY044_01355 [Candidatus Woesebacteria bacterium]